MSAVLALLRCPRGALHQRIDPIRLVSCQLALQGPQSFLFSSQSHSQDLKEDEDDDPSVEVFQVSTTNQQTGFHNNQTVSDSLHWQSPTTTSLPSEPNASTNPNQNTWAELLQKYKSKYKESQDKSKNNSITPQESSTSPKHRGRAKQQKNDHFNISSGLPSLGAHDDVARVPDWAPQDAESPEEAGRESDTVLRATRHGEVRLNSSLMRHIQSIGEFNSEGASAGTSRKVLTLPPDLLRTLGLPEHHQEIPDGPASNGEGVPEEEKRSSAQAHSFSADSLQPEIGPEFRAFISGLPAGTTPSDVRDVVSTYGVVNHVVVHPGTRTSNPFAFVWFKDKGSMLHAVSQRILNIRGEEANIKISQSRPAKPLQASSVLPGPLKADPRETGPKTQQAAVSTHASSANASQVNALERSTSKSEVGNIVRLSGVPASASLVDIKEALLRFGGLRWVQMSPDEDGNCVQVTACFETTEAKFAAQSRGHVFVNGKRVDVSGLHGNQRSVCLRLVRDASSTTSPLSPDELREAVSAIAPVSSLRFRSASVVDVTLETELGWVQTVTQVRRARLSGWRTGNNPKLAHALLRDKKSFVEDESTPALLKRSLKNCKLVLEEMCVELDDLEAVLRRLYPD